jgi:mono/diheme cytochrome c family protein
MVPRLLLPAALFAALAVSSVAIASSGTAASGNPKIGKTLFLRAGVFCGSCHTLKAAGSTGRDGPNLDTSKATYKAVVAAITKGHNPSKRWPTGMPGYGGKHAVLPPTDIKDVAAFVYTSTHH